MKRTLLLTGMILFALLQAKSQTSSLVLKFSDGSSQTTVLSTIRKITFSGSSMVLNMTAGTSQSIDESLISLMQFTDITSAIEDISASGNAVHVFPNPAQNYIRVANISTEQTAYTLYSAEGRALINGTLASADSQIDVSTLSKGLYVIRINNSTLKFMKL